ncbi:hypothetical protein [Cohnella terricola]|uniref:Uncharacterized protein n=1 Tax=Cohnella terricola TaxID=1289167 RepID=A0A559JJ55_9BACL|nr:hypothetical protein [Cohnella terricola]TVX99911.1 hypothetical protein FPZ45_13380 [Cohnella terricola]
MGMETELAKDGGSQRGFVRIVTFLYAAVLIVTLAVVLLFELPYDRISHTWITLTSLFFGETFLYGIALHYLTNSPRSRRLIPAYIAMGTISGVYLIVAIAFILIFSWALDVSAYTYGLLQFIVLGLAAIVMGLMALYMKNLELQEKGT